MHLERREVVDAIHNYWIKKRKQKHSTLVRIFQETLMGFCVFSYVISALSAQKKSFDPKVCFTKKRSFKWQTSKVGSSKQRPLLQDYDRIIKNIESGEAIQRRMRSFRGLELISSKLLPPGQKLCIEISRHHLPNNVDDTNCSFHCSLNAPSTFMT